MWSRLPSPAEVRAFQERGWLAVEDAVPLPLIEALAARAERVHREPSLSIRQPGTRPEDEPGDYVLQSMLTLVWPGWTAEPLQAWTARFAAALLGGPARFWYEQLLEKPPRCGSATWWHQDGASLPPGAGERLISCWLPLQDVDEGRGCMRFLDGSHRGGPLPHELEADLIGGDACARGACAVDPAAEVSVPLRRGGLSFHHGMTPHRATANRSSEWRSVLIQRFVLD